MKWKRFIPKCLLSVVLVLVFGGLIYAQVRTIDEARREHRKWRILRRQPNFSHLASSISGREEPDPFLFQEAAVYYSLLSGYYPEDPDAYLMSGYVRQALGLEREAEAAYRKAVELDPAAFWAYHNLALIELEKRRYAQARSVLEEFFREAAPQRTGPIMRSRVFLQVLAFMPEGYPFGQRRREGLSGCYRMLIMSYARMEDFPGMLAASATALQNGLEPRDEFEVLHSLALMRVRTKRAPPDPALEKALFKDIVRSIEPGLF